MLTKYEFLKIIRRKSTIAVMMVSLLLTAFLFSLPVMQFQSYNQDGAIKGMTGIAFEKEQSKDVSVPLTNSFVASTVHDYQKLFENPDNIGTDGSEKFIIGDAYWDFVAPRTKLLNIIAGNFDMPGENSGWNKLPELNLQKGLNFYDARTEKIDELLKTPSRKLSKKQQDYWRKMSNRVDAPFQFGYYRGWEMIITSFELLMFSILAVCIVLAPVFAGEYQAGTDGVILASKYGKTKLMTAKIVASFLFGAFAFTLHIVVAFGIPLLAFGTEGWNLPLQIANTEIPYPFTFLQATLVNLMVIYLVLLAMIGITLLLSAKVKSSYLVLIVLVPILFIPLFLTPSGTTGLYNLLLFLLPYRSTMPDFSKYVSYQIGGVVFDALSMRAILYVAITVGTIPFARIGFKNHQVSG